MTRDRATKILQRILSTVDSGALPVRIREVWVFGSYARGAPEPGDLDLIVIHEPMPETLKDRLMAEVKEKGLRSPQCCLYPCQRFRSMILSPLRRPGEPGEFLIGCSLKEVFDTYSVAEQGPRALLWSDSQRDWESALASIKADPKAGRTPRHEFMSPKDAGCSLSDMQRLTAWIDGRALDAKRIEPPAWPVPLSADDQSAIDRWTLGRFFGRDSTKCLPLGLWWLRQRRVRRVEAWGRFLHDPDRRWLVYFGSLKPWQIAHDLHTAKAVAQIPRFRRAMPRLLLEFTRGPQWKRLDAIDRDLLKKGGL